ncbi:potassium-transporting ATPase subunit KdpC [Angustibacter aerolatus]|uniref:Potassium-transporting ATPase KdpC subunit n=1 Tax=Angustibacter aerolatus TaxID=1162965 RepID=A0ABQ6JM05_9ACTN|nr:potassium-transporting ATPase subunit KdpC [Angustibacter aerolatus]GMA89278.1 potassium-transporting ATPase KdpC subunit [Angustibacter aerolatus]
MQTTIRTHLAALRVLLVLTVVLGLAYPLAVTLVGRAVPGRADGSLVERGGQVVGSRLIGQAFTDADGRALPAYFQSRPSAAGDGYDGAASSASNLGPESPDLVQAVTERRTAVARLEEAPLAQVPPDAVTASASGLDPDISPAYAALQVARVARARGLDEQVVRRVVREHTGGRDLGFVGAPHVDVLGVNLALDRLAG